MNRRAELIREMDQARQERDTELARSSATQRENDRLQHQLTESVAVAQHLTEQLNDTTERRAREIRAQALAFSPLGEAPTAEVLERAAAYETYLRTGRWFSADPNELNAALTTLFEIISEEHYDGVAVIIARHVAELRDAAAASRRQEQVIVGHAAEVVALNEKLDAAQVAYDKLARENQDLTNEIAEKTNRISTMAEEWNDLNAKRNGLLGDLQDVRSVNKSLRSDLEKLKDPWAPVNQQALAWATIIEHPALKAAYDFEGSLVNGVKQRLTDLHRLEQDSTEMKEDGGEPTATQWVPTKEHVRNVVIDLVSKQSSSQEMRRDFEGLLQWVEEDDTVARLEALGQAQGYLAKAKIIYDLRRGE